MELRILNNGKLQIDDARPEERWIEVAEYCDNDVIATEAAFNHLQADFMASIATCRLNALRK